MAETQTHDYVVVGAGSAGSVIVRRLLDAGHSVHVVEAGSTDTDPNIHSPQGWPALLTGANDWAVMTTPQKHANNRSLYWPRGRVLGGSSSLNGMIYIRGHKSDYDSWAANGAEGWSWNDVLPLFKKSEDHADGASEFHGKGGPLHVERIAERHPAAQAFVEAAKAVGHSRVQPHHHQGRETCQRLAEFRRSGTGPPEPQGHHGRPGHPGDGRRRTRDRRRIPAW